MLFGQSGSELQELDKPKARSRHGRTDSWGDHTKGASARTKCRNYFSAKPSRAALCQLDTSLQRGEPWFGAVGALQLEVNTSHSLLRVRRSVVCSFTLMSIFAYPWQEALVVAVDFDHATGYI